MSEKKTLSRRSFLRATSALAGVATIGGALSPVIAAAATHDSHSNQDKPVAPAAEATPDRFFRAKQFFTNSQEFETLSQAAERIFPANEQGPGAIELCVPYFIDNELAGAFGYNARMYMQGPFAEGAPTQGYQTPLLRRDLFREGIRALNRQANSAYKKDFARLADEQKDEILQQCEAGKIATEGFNSSFFFGELRSAVLAGAYADPIYGGNNKMSGWKMKEFPGAQMSYIDVIASEKFEVMAPQSQADME